MPDYELMYKTLFNETSKAIEILQKAQLETEEIYISGDSNADGDVCVPIKQ